MMTTSASLSPSQQVKYIAEQFIYRLSSPPDQRGVCSLWRELLTEEEKTALAQEEQIFSQNNESFDGTGFYEINHGENNVVWGHERFPQLVFKSMGELRLAENQARVARTCHQFVCSQNLFWVRVPVATLIPCLGANGHDGRALYVEERLPLEKVMDPEGHTEFWSRIFLHLRSPDCSSLFKDNLLILFKQSVWFIQAIGFSDVGIDGSGTRNFPEVSPKGLVCATDFEEIHFLPYDGVWGIKELARTFCHPPFSTYLVDKYLQEGISIDVEHNNNKQQYFDLQRDFLTNLSNDSTLCLARQRAIQCYDANPWVETQENIPTQFDTTGMSELEIQVEQALIAKCQKRLAWTDLVLTDRRCLQVGKYWIPTCLRNVEGADEILHRVVEKFVNHGFAASWWNNAPNFSGHCLQKDFPYSRPHYVIWF